jgi:hypothetical protein
MAAMLLVAAETLVASSLMGVMFTSTFPKIGRLFSAVWCSGLHVVPVVFQPLADKMDHYLFSQIICLFGPARLVPM